MGTPNFELSFSTYTVTFPFRKKYPTSVMDNLGSFDFDNSTWKTYIISKSQF